MKYIGALILIFTFNTLLASAKLAGLEAYRNYHAVADTDTVKPIRKSSASVGVTYGSDALFFGRTGPIKYPFVSTDIVINSKPGFFAYGSALKVLGYKPLVDEIDVGGGYYYRLSKKYTGTISYTRFIFNKEANIIKSASSNDINWKNSFDFKSFRASITADYLFGKSYDVFTTLSVSKYIESKFSIFNDQDYLSVTPSVSMILGTQNFVQRYAVDHERTLEYTNIYLPDENARMARANSRFNALNYSFKLPLAYNTPHYTLEASWRYSMPVNVEGLLRNHRESFFNFTFYYVFY
ncbi:hypothetical protein CKK33_03935 [Mucilaginibacter sp. MD40]|uniref:hypothetical protein n=1 Tax=Mucilaginibacter sp. MD40 TaxID=2029590 RepID=UPI000BAC514E|nr:hypothetical protein [Mucilaginibacter sp. MD40]PAW92690.1 hypothetical protein CKK33_03935 [Mucilaginibacter sp. MD40]